MSLLPGIMSRASGRAVSCWRRAPGIVGVRGLSMDNKAGAAKPNMALIRELREASGAPVVDCKNALEVSNKSHREREGWRGICVDNAAVAVGWRGEMYRHGHTVDCCGGGKSFWYGSRVQY